VECLRCGRCQITLATCYKSDDPSNIAKALKKAIVGVTVILRPVCDQTVKLMGVNRHTEWHSISPRRRHTGHTPLRYPVGNGKPGRRLARTDAGLWHAGRKLVELGSQLRTTAGKSMRQANL